MVNHLEERNGSRISVEGAPVAGPRTSEEPVASTSRSAPDRPSGAYYDALLRRIWSRRAAAEVGLLVGLTGCRPQSGVSTLAANLAIRAADYAVGSVLLVDANMQSPELHKLARCRAEAGLADVLSERQTFDDAICATHLAGLHVLPIGNTEPAANLRIKSSQAAYLLSQVRQRYALTIIDLPTADRLGKTLMLAQSLDLVLLIVRSAHVRRGLARSLTGRLAADKVPLAGAVLTDWHTDLPRWLDRLL